MTFLKVLLVVAAIAFPPAHSKNNTLDSEVCLTRECQQYAKTMLRYMNSSANPCDDFYEFACGNFDTYEAIQPGKSKQTQFSILSERNSKIIRNILEQPMSSFRSDAERKAKQFYDTCINMDKISAESLKGIRAIVDELGGFYLFANSTIPESWSLTEQLIARTKYSQYGLFSFAVNQDDKNASRNLMSVDQGGLGLSARDYYLNKSIDDDPILVAYTDFLVAVATKILQPISSHKNGDDFELVVGGVVDVEAVKDVVRFEQKLATIFQTPARRRRWDKMYNLMTIAELQTLCPSIDWRKFFWSVTQSVGIDGLPNEEIIVYGKIYFDRLRELLETTLSTTNGRKTLRNYLMFRSVNKYVPKLSQDFRDLHDLLQKALTGKKGVQPVWELCVLDTVDALGFAVGSIYVREHFKTVARQKSEEMISEVRVAWKDRLSKASWMDDETKIKALEKADAMKYNIGYPEWCLNDTELNAYYENLNISDDNLQNHVNDFLNGLLRKFKWLREKPDHSRWSMDPTEVNAYYTSRQNKIVFPAGILQPPYFSDAVPNALNFGGIGMIIGHEIVHGFDDAGRLFSYNGELLNWWDNQTDAQFRSRAKCISDQYSEYSSSGLKFRGNQTVGENIADNGGIKVAYQAFKHLQQSTKKSNAVRLPGVDLNEDQLFFLNFAQVWCAIYTPEALRNQIFSGSHTVPQFRVTGTLSNSQEFASAFNCSTMMSSNKCEIW